MKNNNETGNIIIFKDKDDFIENNNYKINEAKKGNYLCGNVDCKNQSKYIMVAKNNSFTKMYCDFHIKGLMMHQDRAELFWLKGQKPPFDYRCSGEFEIEDLIFE